MKKSLLALVVTGLMLSSAGQALAAVTFNADDGTGFVGKGDVQLALGWSNAQLQANAAAVGFSYDSSETYEVTCYWETTTGQGNIIKHTVTNKKSQGVAGSVAGDPRQVKGQKQFTGFNLTGYVGDPVVTGGAINCPQGGGSAEMIGLELLEASGGLFAIFDGQSYLLD
ncbi:hypothetical protein [Nocardioides limicola]|uniref:hypothetical protein n=1 Tax=Nocardioides limicola TaxID=2803368 RepID=UPI00193C1EDB|nr:hypothetical protein [Nocardioides sp. DJM-14]